MIAVKRKAILIDASDVKGENDLPGARVDIDNWTRFLLSSLGGSWAADEIAPVLHKPLLGDVLRLLDANSDAYCFVAFSGHGSEGTVALNDHNKSCPVSALKPKGTRGAMVIDSCRGIDMAQPFSSSLSKSAGILTERAGGVVMLNARDGSVTNFSRTDDARAPMTEHVMSAARFKSALGASGAGIVSMLSCAKGEGAGEDPESGGYYTSALLDSAIAFYRDLNRKDLLTTKEAHDYAAALMPKQQNPEYSPISLSFPFAVKLGVFPVI